MKKVIVLSLLALAFSFCQDPGTQYDYNDVIIEHNKIQYKVKYIVLNSSGNGIYVMYPINDTTKTIPQVINYTSGKSHHAIVKLE